MTNAIDEFKKIRAQEIPSDDEETIARLDPKNSDK